MSDLNATALPENGARLSVVIVTYKTCEMTLRCLSSVFADIGDSEAEVIVIDNASKDGTADAIRANFPTVRLVVNECNVGFGTANNVGMQMASGSNFILLNTDAFLKPGAIQAMKDYLLRNPKCGVVGPRILNSDGSLQRSCYRFPSPFRAWVENLGISKLTPNHPWLGDYRDWQHDRERSVEWVIGACMMIRREAFEQSGGFDEAFFMYQEEADWQRSIRSNGWFIGFAPAAEVTHLGGASGAREKARIRRHFFESLDYYERKHHGFTGLILLRMAMVIGCSVRAVVWLAALPFPSMRRRAAEKIALHVWLVIRQVSYWRIGVSARRNSAT